MAKNRWGRGLKPFREKSVKTIFASVKSEKLADFTHKKGNRPAQAIAFRYFIVSFYKCQDWFSVRAFINILLCFFHVKFYT